MKATELRLMNLIYNKQGNTVYVNTNHLTILLYGIENEFKPIPLTEEWLLKFGFKWKGLIAKGRYLTLFTPCGKAIVYKESHFIFTGVTIEVQTNYVHQLQNLYFALTGKELILNA
jgi:hypothetical protein